MNNLLAYLFEDKPNITQAVYILTKQLGAKITYSTLKENLEEHPDHSTFLSISDVLKNHGIDNITAKFEKEQYTQLPVPFLTQIKLTENELFFTVVKNVELEKVQYFNPKNQKWDTIALEEFFKISSGVVLLAEVEANIIEKDYSKKIIEEKRVKISGYLMSICIPLILLLTIFYTLYNHKISALLPSFFSITTLLGTAVTLLLLWYEVDNNNPLLQQICTQGKKTNCGAILNSKDSKIFGISWSTIGFVYFSGSLIILLVNGIFDTSSLVLLSFLNAFAVPYVFYSIYYQWKIAKQWCVLCLLVQSILVIQLIITCFGEWHNVSLIDNSAIVPTILQMVFAFSIPFIIVTIVLPIAKKAQERDKYLMELIRLKHNPEIFNVILSRQKSISESTYGLGIILGNPDGDVKVIKVCSPYCPPCSRAHTPIEQLIENNQNLQVQIIFTASSDSLDERSYPVKHLLAIYEHYPHLIEQALNDWYLAKDKDYNQFASKYPIKDELNAQLVKVDAMYNWCRKSEIQHTPTFFINGYQMPINYNVNDIKYFLSA